MYSRSTLSCINSFDYPNAFYLRSTLFQTDRASRMSQLNGPCAIRYIVSFGPSIHLDPLLDYEYTWLTASKRC